jgi:hypothetical protein
LGTVTCCTVSGRAGVDIERVRPRMPDAVVVAWLVIH